MQDTNAPLLSGKFDHIVASDILYEPDNAKQVAEFVQQHAADTATLWVIDPNRGYHNHLRRHLAEYGFEQQEHTRLVAASDEPDYRGRFLVFQR